MLGIKCQRQQQEVFWAIIGVGAEVPGSPSRPAQGSQGIRTGRALFSGIDQKGICTVKVIRFQGRYTSQDAVFFLNPDSKTVVVTELSGTFLKGLTLNDYDFEALLATGRL